MEKNTAKRSLRKKLLLLIPMVLVLAVAVFGVVYVNDYYHTEAYAEQFLISSETVTVTQKEGIVFLDGKGEDTALIFYPGAKVEYTAYVPLFYALAEQGVDCFLMKMPGNLAIIGTNRAAEVLKKYEYENWYISGHSLGGAVATGFAAAHPEELKGIVLLAAYPMKDLSQTNLSVLSVYGSEDLVLNREKLVSGREQMPENYTELCIEGGNHAWFAWYGEQAGDGKAVITKEEQQKTTLDAILAMLSQ